MVAEPEDTPVTIPVPAPTVALVVLLLLQTPPGAASDNVIVEPAHTAEGPEIVPALTLAITVMVLVTVAAPHAPETV